MKITSGPIAASTDAILLSSLVDDGVASIQVTGTYTGALKAQVRSGGSTWFDVPVINRATGASTATIVSAAVGMWTVNVSGCDAIQVIPTGAVTGSANVVIRATALSDGNSVAGSSSATAANQTAEAALIGPVNETAPASDTASSGLNGRLQRIAQRLTTILTALLDGTLFSSRFPSGVVGAGIVPVTTTVAASSLVLKASAGNLYGFNVTSGGTAGYALVSNLAAAASDGTVTPARSYAMAANTSLEVSYDPPLRMSVGAVVAFSSTGPFTQTLSATAHISGQCV